MEYIRCAIYERKFRKGSCPRETGGATEGNSTCPQCDYYKTYLTPTKTAALRPSNKFPKEKCEEEKLQQFKSIYLLKEAFGIRASIETSGELNVAKLQRKNSFDGKPESECQYWFTKETRNHFEDLLRDHDEEKVKNFIYRIESDIGNFVKVRRDPARIDLVKETIKTLEQANGLLLKIYSGRLKVLCQPKHSYAYKFKNPDEPLSTDIYEAVKADCEVKSKIVLRSLPGLIRDLRSAVTIEKRKRGQPNADGDDLAFQIASWFREFIEPPRPFSGPFPKIVRKSFEICEVSRGRNRCSRAIGYALKKLSSSRPAQKILQK